MKMICYDQVVQLLHREVILLVVLLSKLGKGESLQGAEPLMFVDHPVNVLSLFYRVLFPGLFTRFFLLHLKSEDLKVV